jgi:MoaA/NifB/PqqE/SkfB family radical SAM enzyme
MAEAITGVHIEPTNICTLKCPGCSRTDLIEQWPQHWKNHYIDVDQLMTFLDVDLTDKPVMLCGNYGDPIYHPNFIELATALKKRKANLDIITNGSYKTAEWWTQLTDILDAKDIVTFSIDGIPENFTTYRINADWPSIEQGIKICVASRCKTQWKYIPFLYNQHNVEQARELGNKLGIDRFFIDPSNRFNDNTKHLKPTEELVDFKQHLQTEWKNTDHAVDPVCNNGHEHFISADGHYVSCCMLSDFRFYYKTTFGKNKKEYSIANTTLTDILNKPTVVEFYNTLNEQRGCQYFCPKTPVDQ